METGREEKQEEQEEEKHLELDNVRITRERGPWSGNTGGPQQVRG